MNRPQPISVPWTAAPPAAPARLQTSGHEIQLLSASLDFQIRTAGKRTARLHPHHPVRAHRAAFIIAKPPTGSLKMIIGILQHNLKTRAFFAHPDHFASDRLEICRIGTHPHQNRRQKADYARVAGKRGGAAGHSQPKLVAAHPVGYRYLGRKTVAPPSALVRASVPDTASCPWPMPFGIAMILA